MANAGLAIEYVRSRKVVRLLGWLYGDPIEPVEIPVEPKMVDRESAAEDRVTVPA